ncbi:MAG: hypothetical protein WBG48_10915 [Pricia sp.]
MTKFQKYEDDSNIGFKSDTAVRGIDNVPKSIPKHSWSSIGQDGK